MCDLWCVRYLHRSTGTARTLRVAFKDSGSPSSTAPANRLPLINWLRTIVRQHFLIVFILMSNEELLTTKYLVVYWLIKTWHIPFQNIRILTDSGYRAPIFTRSPSSAGFRTDDRSGTQTGMSDSQTINKAPRTVWSCGTMVGDVRGIM